MEEIVFFFLRFERAIRKRPNTVRCLAVKRALLGTRHPRKEKEAALQNISGEIFTEFLLEKKSDIAENEPDVKLI